jgi:hypothetical protein
MPQYVSADAQKSDQLEQQAVTTFESGQQAGEIGDTYVLNTVFLASALFLAGIASRFAWPPARLAILATSATVLAVGLYNVVRLPVH